MRFIDHYTKGARAALKLPKRVQDHPTIYRNEIEKAARKYEARFDGTERDYNTDGDIRGEFLNGIEDTLYKLVEDGKHYAVFAWTGTGRYPIENAISPIFTSESVAHRWMRENKTRDERFTGGPEHRGFVVRGTYEKR